MAMRRRQPQKGVIQNTKKKWTQPVHNWGHNYTPKNVPFCGDLLLSQLSILFEDKLEKALKQ
jgi:hypothetical protein